jgi:hypothetical protein
VAIYQEKRIKKSPAIDSIAGDKEENAKQRGLIFLFLPAYSTTETKKTGAQNNHCSWFGDWC